ncbi:GL20682 [Drosophila persimilis]|uniref:GL20682 n=2 Tax=Drosophila persimilis TaxID=7234 RepID=B4IRN6_DROPE|nr:GL20682 [Drosophila persimilis]
MNHSCPYDHDLIVDKLTIEQINNRFSKLLAFPEGDYMVESHFLAYGINRAVVKVYFTLS